MTGMADDDILKSSMLTFALAEYEIALYESLLTLAEPAGAPDARPLLAAASEKKPDQFRPRFYLAEAQLELGDAAAAEQNYTESLRLDAKSAGAELGLGRAIARQNRLEEAAPHFRKAAELDAGFRDVLLELAALYEKTGSREEAVAIYRQFPDNTAAQERIGQLLLQANQAAAARLICGFFAELDRPQVRVTF